MARLCYGVVHSLGSLVMPSDFTAHTESVLLTVVLTGVRFRWRLGIRSSKPIRGARPQRTVERGDPPRWFCS